MVVIEVVSASSVRVSWEGVDIPEITGYTVYYSQTGNRNRQSEELFVTVPSSVNSVVIGDLVSNVEYQFQVAAIAELDGVVFTGTRSIVTAKVVALSRDVNEASKREPIAFSIYWMVVTCLCILSSGAHSWRGPGICVCCYHSCGDSGVCSILGQKVCQESWCGERWRRASV